MTSEIRIFPPVDQRRFDAEIRHSGQPAVFKGLVADWPLVREGLESPGHAAGYLQSLSRNAPVEYLVADHSTEGRFFYNEALNGVNFARGRTGLRDLLDKLVALSSEAHPAAISLQALPVPVFLPQLRENHRLSLVPPGTEPNIWIGNALTVAPHFDLNDNIACVACGRRRFTLFPPDQLANLYVGPLEATPQGVPISLVDVNKPDFERFPRFKSALAAAQVAELEPGDAIFIPYMWWHSVQSLSKFNVLLNYWWNEARFAEGVPFHALVHAIIAIGKLPPAQRRVWKSYFDHYVFALDGAPAEHIPAAQRGILGNLTTEQARQRLLELGRTMGGGTP